MTDINDKISYRIDEAVKASGLGRSFLYEKMSEGLLRSVKIGGRRLILRTDLLDFVNHGSSVWRPEPAPLSAVRESEPAVVPPPSGAQLELPFRKLQ